ncbi:MAG: hypothetical protein IPL55_22860 [Saprospiraceae bacterium]|nr:hypothetical protein [Saprospiraceae bacterium]
METRNKEEIDRYTSILKHKDYYKFIFSGECVSDWCRELKSKLISIDKFIEKDTIIQTEKLEFYLTLLWFYKINIKAEGRVFDELKRNYTFVENGLKGLIPTNDRIIELKLLPENDIIHYKFYNKFQINNPIFNNAEQTLEQYFYFDKDLNLFKREDI